MLMALGSVLLEAEEELPRLQQHQYKQTANQDIWRFGCDALHDGLKKFAHRTETTELDEELVVCSLIASAHRIEN